jgi:hypothetical protein
VLDDLLTRTLAVLMAEGLVTPEEIIRRSDEGEGFRRLVRLRQRRIVFSCTPSVAASSATERAVLNIRPDLRHSDGVGMQLYKHRASRSWRYTMPGLQRFHSANLAEPNTLAGESNTNQRSPAKPAWC